MSASDEPWALAVDFGTLNTRATIRRRGVLWIQAVRLYFGGPAMHSGVLAAAEGLVVGEQVPRRALLHPEAYERSPKRLMGRSSVMLGEKEYAVQDLVAAVLSRVAHRVAREAPSAEPAAVLLTHPLSWGGAERQQLLAAAAQAGFDPAVTSLVAEPVAVAQHYGFPRPLPDGALVAVVTAGAGACSAALLRAGANGFDVLSAHDDHRLGGIDIDNRFTEFILDDLRRTGREDLVFALMVSPRQRASLQVQIEGAKATLFNPEHWQEGIHVHDDVELASSGRSRQALLHITPATFSELIAPTVQGMVALTDRTLREGVPPGEELQAVYLSGATSAIPAIRDGLMQLTGRAPLAVKAPELAVVTGAHRTADVWGGT